MELVVGMKLRSKYIDGTFKPYIGDLIAKITKGRKLVKSTVLTRDGDAAGHTK